MCGCVCGGGFSRTVLIANDLNAFFQEGPGFITSPARITILHRAFTVIAICAA